MCFSAAASFSVGTALMPAAAYCITKALRRDRSYLPFAAVPLFFGIQQICEGFVWIGLNHDDAPLATTAAVYYLFFALWFWPFWISFCTLFTEPQRRRRIMIGLIVLISLSWFVFLYFPIWVDPVRWLTIQVIHHSIQYVYTDLPIIRMFSPVWLKVLYFATVAAPLLVCTGKTSTSFGVLLGLSAVISYFVYKYAFVSVWCFFASFLALYLCTVFYGLPPVKSAAVD